VLIEKLTQKARGRERTEEGLVTIIVALTLVALLIVSAIVLDFGVARLNRQENKSAADSAVMAGLRAADGGSTSVYSERGVCAALDYLKANSDALSGLPQSFCSSTVVSTSTVTCDEASPETNAVDYSGTTTSGGVDYTVEIKSPYEVTEGSFPDEDYPTLASDTSQLNGCDQLAVIVTQSRGSLFGDLASTSDLTTTIRSVGRVAISAGDDAPALLLLKQSGCPVLQTGSNSGDSTIRVYGALSSDLLRSSPGTIHADSNGSGCSGGPNQNIFLGRAGSGIVALAAPLASNPSLPDSSKPGQITSLWGLTNAAAGVGYDSVANVFGSGAVNEAGISAASKSAPLGRALVTRRLVDNRYFSGVKGVISIAKSNIFDSTTGLTAANAVSRGYKVLANCNPTALDLVAAGITLLTQKIFIDCTTNAGYKGTVALGAEEIVFNGVVNPGSVISMPNATKVYVFGLAGKDAITLTGGGGISMHTAGNLSGSQCTSATRTSSNKALLVIKQGGLKESTGGVLQLCNTTVINMGGQDNGCVPSNPGQAPRQDPCGGGMGSGQLSQTGGSVDWTAPNSIDITVDSAGDPTTGALAGWGDVNGPEDLAFWSESAGNNSSTTYNMNGQGGLHTVGVYMVPNADSFSIGGGATQNLVNAQYIATSIALNGAGTNITMRVDPNSAITLPELDPFTLVR
jgi:hypothetical protein